MWASRLLIPNCPSLMVTPVMFAGDLVEAWGAPLRCAPCIQATGAARRAGAAQRRASGCRRRVSPGASPNWRRRGNTRVKRSRTRGRCGWSWGISLRLGRAELCHRTVADCLSPHLRGLGAQTGTVMRYNRAMVDQEQDVISGSVERITYYNEENGYTVLRVKPDSRDMLPFKYASGRDALITVVGNLPELSPGEWVKINGRWAQPPQTWAPVSGRTAGAGAARDHHRHQALPRLGPRPRRGPGDGRTHRRPVWRGYAGYHRSAAGASQGGGRASAPSALPPSPKRGKSKRRSRT